jgi:hypothetical protein
MGKNEEFFRLNGFWPTQAYYEGDNYDIQEAKKRALEPDKVEEKGDER